jgi:hypothetical protein
MAIIASHDIFKFKIEEFLFLIIKSTIKKITKKKIEMLVKGVFFNI